MTQAGSSPLARGLLTSDYGMRVNPGIIPARAGFTSGFYEGADMLAGSSPLARGLPRVDPYGDAAHRIIPARAGFTSPAMNAA